MAPTVPDRWPDYKPIGERIAGTRFIAFKVPLRADISDRFERPIRLDHKIIFGKIPKLGFIIDLTNTHRYYDPSTFMREGIGYLKIMVPGKVVPPTHLVKHFNFNVKQFLQNNEDNDKLIGVHCTHGVNRTGYFICNYMITELKMEPDEAIKRFTKARGHNIERENYVDALLKLNKINQYLDKNARSPNDTTTSTSNSSSYNNDKQIEIISHYNNTSNWRSRDHRTNEHYNRPYSTFFRNKKNDTSSGSTNRPNINDDDNNDIRGGRESRSVGSGGSGGGNSNSDWRNRNYYNHTNPFKNNSKYHTDRNYNWRTNNSNMTTYNHNRNDIPAYNSTGSSSSSSNNRNRISNSNWSRKNNYNTHGPNRVHEGTVINRRDRFEPYRIDDTRQGRKRSFTSNTIPQSLAPKIKRNRNI